MSSVGIPSLDTVDGSQQFLRTISLVVFDNNLNGIDLSKLRIKFSVKRSDTQTPNIADIRIYNLSQDQANSLFSTLAPKTIDTTTGLTVNRGHVILQAGYVGNYGVIFQGNIKQIIIGRESATDTFVDLNCGDGDNAYNFAIVNTTLAKGSTAMDQLNAASASMKSYGVTLGNTGVMPPTQLPRGKVLFGNSRDCMRRISQSTNQSWSIQNQKITFIPKKSFLPGQIIELTSATGMIGTPQQTNTGVNVKCLLNPLIQMGGRIKINNASIQRYKLNLAVPLSAENTPAPLNADGVYYVFVAEYTGDTRGIEWYTTLSCLTVDITTNSLNSVQPGYGASGSF